MVFITLFWCLDVKLVNEMKGSGAVQVIFVHMFFSHHQTQVQGNKKGEKSSLPRNFISW